MHPQQQKLWKDRPNNNPFLWQQLADAALFMICLLPPLIPMLLPLWMTKKIPFLISSDRV